MYETLHHICFPLDHDLKQKESCTSVLLSAAVSNTTSQKTAYKGAIRHEVCTKQHCTCTISKEEYDTGFITLDVSARVVLQLRDWSKSAASMEHDSTQQCQHVCSCTCSDMNWS